MDETRKPTSLQLVVFVPCMVRSVSGTLAPRNFKDADRREEIKVHVEPVSNKATVLTLFTFTCMGGNRTTFSLRNTLLLI